MSLHYEAQKNNIDNQPTTKQKKLEKTIHLAGTHFHQ